MGRQKLSQPPPQVCRKSQLPPGKRKLRKRQSRQSKRVLSSHDLWKAPGLFSWAVLAMAITPAAFGTRYAIKATTLIFRKSFAGKTPLRGFSADLLRKSRRQKLQSACWMRLLA